MPEEPAPRFAVGARVQDVRDRSRIGTIEDGPEIRGGRTIWMVRWDVDRAIGRVPEEYLQPFSERVDLWGLLRSHAYGGLDDLVKNYTHRKLLNPVDDTLYVLFASKTQILPHQFKPLLKFLDSVHRRYLVADEVGLGKTIEAGIILSELRARDSLGGVLVYCPNHLRDKWHSELFRRFDERFEIVHSRRDWLRFAGTAEDAGTTGSRLILGHKTAASRNILEQMASNGAPGFDLVIVDEAHHFKNTETISRRVLGELADAASQLLLLTATPLETATDNLLSLLRLLDFNAFQAKYLYERRLETNAHLVAAERRLRSAASREALADAARHALEDLATIPAALARMFGLDEKGDLSGVVEQLNRCVDAPSVQSVADVAGKIRELNLLSPYVTRTRKVEVQDTCKRRVESLRPDLSAAEREFYDRVVAWIRTAIAARHGHRSVLFLSRNIERHLASSLHAFAAHLRRGGYGKDGILSNPPAEVLAAAAQLTSRDAKFENLIRVLEQLDSERPDTKTIVFASYRGTLRYLKNRLESRGWDTELIHGGVPSVPDDPEQDERGRAVERFLKDRKCRVLLSSNVGGEGLDLQRASVVINYDLPWNPAKVEQRIGRVDRFGQTEPVVQVFNFLLPGTVEDLIFTRLFLRLHLFEATVGDFAEILGALVKEFSTYMLQRELTARELEQQLGQLEWRAQNARQNLESVLGREHEFVAFDDDFADQLRAFDERAQTIRPTDLASVVDAVLARYFPHSWIKPVSHGSDATGADEFELYIDPNLREELRGRAQERDGRILWSLLQRTNEQGVVRVTFDGETAERREGLLLLTTRHPFLRFLVRHRADPGAFHPFSVIRVRAPGFAGAEPGLVGLFDAVFRLGRQERRYLMPIWVSGDRVAELDESRRRLRAILDYGESVRPPVLPSGEELCRMLEETQLAADRYLEGIKERVLSREEARIRPRVAEARERYARRIQRAEERLSAHELTLEHEDTEENRTRVRHARDYGRRLHRERDELIERLSSLPEPETSLVAVGAAWVESFQ